MTDDIESILIKFGVKRAEAKIIFHLIKNPQSTSRLIERKADLRQPEVSQALKNLIKRKWVICRPVKNPKKGRPFYEYKLAKTEQEIFGEIIFDIEKRVDELEESIQKIKKR